MSRLKYSMSSKWLSYGFQEQQLYEEEEQQKFLSQETYAGLGLDHLQLGIDARKNLSSRFANNTGADQPGHPRSLISAFVIRFSVAEETF